MRIATMRGIGTLAAIGLAGSVSGCALPGIASQPPTLAEMGLADRYSDTTPPEVAREPTVLDHTVLDPWRHQLGDPLLDLLIDQGRSDNLDLQAAAGRKPETPMAQAQRRAVTAAIARTYVQLRARQAMIGNVQASLAAQQDLIKVAHFREEARLVTALDSLRIAAEGDRLAAMTAPLEAEIAARIARLSVLTGQAPAALRDRLITPAPIPAGPADIAIGLPSDLIGKRPDVSTAAARLRKHAPWRAPSPGATSAYKQQVLLALEDVEKARAVFVATKANAQALDKAAATAEQAALLARKQYRDGLTDYGALKDAEQALLSARNALARGQASRAQASIDLWVALDGGDGGADRG